MYSANNDQVCAQDCSGSGGFNILNEATLVLTCTSCALPMKQLDVFCVDSCKQYFLAHCNPTSLAADDTTGECRRPVEQSGVCMVSTYNAAMTLGDSGKLTGCTTAGYYMKDYVCM